MDDDCNELWAPLPHHCQHEIAVRLQDLHILLDRLPTAGGVPPAQLWRHAVEIAAELVCPRLQSTLFQFLAILHLCALPPTVPDGSSNIHI